MTAFLTILLDSFRMLKSSLIFWITLGISGLVAVLYLALGFDEAGVTFFGFSIFEDEMVSKGTMGAEVLYKLIFDQFIIGAWLSWAAVILALISCASIYPKMMEEGSAGMLMTKRPSRLMIFFSKYLGSLLFIIVQVSLFVVIVLIAMRWRLGTWNFEILWFIPATVMVFSFLFSFLVLIAVWTRSVLTAILLTMALWLISFIVESVEESMYRSAITKEFFTEVFTEEKLDGQAELNEEESAPNPWHRRVKIAYAIFPKITPTIAEARKAQTIRSEETGLPDPPEEEGLSDETEGFFDGLTEGLEIETKVAERHSLFYTIGTSLLFEAVMLSLAARSFCRREF